MKKIFMVMLQMIAVYVSAQETTTLLKEAANLEQKFNEPEALAKYKQVVINEPNNYLCLQKATILSCRIGSRSADKNEKKLQYQTALSYATRAYLIDSNNAESSYLLSVANGRLAEVEEENKKRVEYVRNTKIYVDKALAINPNHANANFVLGKWHYEMVVLSWVKKVAIKTLYGGLSEPSIEKSIEYLEKSRKLDPYNALCYLTLAKAYKENDNNNKYLEIIKLLVKLPKRTFDDTAYIEEGKKLLEDEK